MDRGRSRPGSRTCTPSATSINDSAGAGQAAARRCSRTSRARSPATSSGGHRPRKREARFRGHGECFIETGDGRPASAELLRRAAPRRRPARALAPLARRRCCWNRRGCGAGCSAPRPHARCRGRLGRRGATLDRADLLELPVQVPLADTEDLRRALAVALLSRSTRLMCGARPRPARPACRPSLLPNAGSRRTPSGRCSPRCCRRRIDERALDHSQLRTLPGQPYHEHVEGGRRAHTGASARSVPDEVVHQQRDVLAACAAAGSRAEHIQPVIEILAEGPLHHGLETRLVAAITRTLTLMSVVPPTRRNVPVSSAQRFTQRRRDLADLVQEDRAAVGARTGRA